MSTRLRQRPTGDGITKPACAASDGPPVDDQPVDAGIGTCNKRDYQLVSDLDGMKDKLRKG